MRRRAGRRECARQGEHHDRLARERVEPWAASCRISGNFHAWQTHRAIMPNVESSMAWFVQRTHCMARVPERDIIIIGGSAGALRPLTAILESLPEDLPAAVF